MLIDINKIIVNDRIRKDFGNIEELAEDIKQNGLINPPTVNKDYVLLAGERRLRACKFLGWGQIPVHMLDTKDEAHDLAVEMSENNLRRNFTGSELAEGIRRQMALESEKAKERMADGGRGANICTPSGKSRDKAAEQFGISGEQARKTLYVDDHKDLLDASDFADWDEGRLSTNKAFQRVKAAMAQAEKERDEARKDAEEVSELYGKTIVQRDQAESERKRIERELRKASITQTNLEMEAESLRQQLATKPEPEVIEREVEVVREVVPEDVQQRINELERLNNLYLSDYQKLRRRNEDMRKELDRAHDILNLDETTREVQRDVQYLVTSTNQYIRHYGGLTWTVQSLSEVDGQMIEELHKAVRNLATFANTLMNCLEEING